MADYGNMLLRGARDANDTIRDTNAAATRTWESTTQPEDAAEKEAKSWYHGAVDTANVGTLGKSAFDTASRMKNLGVSYGQLASIDGRRAGNSLSKLGQGANETIESIKGGVAAAGDRVGATIANVGAKGMGLDSGLEIGDKGYVAAAPALKVTAAGGEAVGGGFKGVQTVADLSEGDLKTAAVNFGELSAKDSSTIADVGKTATAAAEGAGAGIKQIIGGKLLGTEVGSVASKGLGKVVGNVGGAVDLYKDFENIGKKGGFFGGTGTTGVDEASNVATLAGSALDVASMALPFLAPVAAAVQIGGAILGTYSSIKDADNKTKNDKGTYEANQTNVEVPPSLASTGFLASAQSNPMKLNTGSGTF